MLSARLVLVSVWVLVLFFFNLKNCSASEAGEHQDSLPLFQAGRREFKCAAYKENGGRTIN